MRVNAEDASRADVEFLIDFALAGKEAGAERFRYCDTLGYDSPFSIYDRIIKIAEASKCLLNFIVITIWEWLSPIRSVAPKQQLMLDVMSILTQQLMELESDLAMLI